jgi:tetratricopeptide (TPR) repeat protein
MNGNGDKYDSMCFVIMPFGAKPVGAAGAAAPRIVDFDKIYNEIFKPAIEDTPLLEGGKLIPYRTDMNPAAAVIDVEMFGGIAYSRMVLCDISSLNANVFYELGVRHHSHESGTAIFRQADSPIPFDISHIKAVPYEYEPADNAKRSRESITRVLTESLKQNLIDSPIQISLRDQRQKPADLQEILRAAEDCIRAEDPDGAIAKYQEALKRFPNSPLIRFKVGLLNKYKGHWADARDSFREATRLQDGYADAFRELGIAENKLRKNDSPADAPTGEESLRRAVQLNPSDFDAHASLGGVLKRLGRLDAALAEYTVAAQVSEGHPYPLLNELKLRAASTGRVELTDGVKFKLARAERYRRAQVLNSTPLDSPWCFFDLSEIRLYFGSKDDFLKYLEEGLLQPSTRGWQAKTNRESLEFLARAGYDPPGLKEGLDKLRVAEANLPP